MSYTFEDFEREYLEEVSQTWSPKDLLEILPVDALLKEIPVEDRLKEVPPNKIFQLFPPAVIEEYLSKLKKS